MNYNFKGPKHEIGKTFVIFLRHGNKDHNKDGFVVPGPELNRKGIKQSELAARELSKIKDIDRLFTSPMLRARQTSEIICKKIKKKPTALNDFYEFRNLSGDKPSFLVFLREYFRYKKVSREFDKILESNKGKKLVFCLLFKIVTLKFMAIKKKFGAFAGVFTPSILTILGVIMYMRLGWVVGNAGLIGTIIIILFAHVIAISTGLSLSSVATDKKIGAGGI